IHVERGVVQQRGIDVLVVRVAVLGLAVLPSPLLDRNVGLDLEPDPTLQLFPTDVRARCGRREETRGGTVPGGSLELVQGMTRGGRLDRGATLSGRFESRKVRPR